MKRILQTALKKQKLVNSRFPKYYSKPTLLTKEEIEVEFKRLDEFREELKNPNLTADQINQKKRDIKFFDIIFKALLDPDGVKDIKFDDIEPKKENPNLGVQFAIGPKGREKMFYLRTNNENTIIFPNKTSAIAALSEWEIQTEMIRFENLPLSLLFGQIEDLKLDKATLRNACDEILKYFDAETICHRELLTPQKREKYEKVWDPIVNWFNEKYETKLKIFESEELIGDAHQEDAKNAFKKHLSNYDAYKVGLLYALVKTTDSVIVSIAMLEGFLNDEEALQAAHADVFVAIETNGLVYGEHDIFLSQKKMKLSTIALVKALIQEGIE